MGTSVLLSHGDQCPLITWGPVSSYHMGTSVLLSHGDQCPLITGFTVYTVIIKLVCSNACGGVTSTDFLNVNTASVQVEILMWMIY